MAMKAEATSRAPRGTKVLMKAFFTAADEIPGPQRDAVVRAALAGIRDELKAVREKGNAAKAKTHASDARAPKKAAPPKRAAKKAAAVKPVAKKARAKPAPTRTPDETAEA
jgi:hypothetical protein